MSASGSKFSGRKSNIGGIALHHIFLRRILISMASASFRSSNLMDDGSEGALLSQSNEFEEEVEPQELLQRLQKVRSKF